MTTLTDTQVITASGGLVELGYKESSSTTNITVSGTAGNGTEIISPLTVVCDGGPVLVEFDAVNVAPNPTAGHYISLSLYVDGSEYSRFWTYSQTPSSGFFATPVHATLRIAPSAGSHTFSVRAFISNAGSNGTVGSGDKSTTGSFPPRLRVSKIVQATQWPAVTTGTIICTSSTRPAAPFEGQEIYETDTDLEQRWTGSAWVVSGSTGTSFLSASSTTTVSAASTITYTQASITLTPGVWEVTSAMTLINGTTTDSAAVAIYNQTAAAVVSGSYGTPGYTSTTWAAALQSMPTKMTVTSNTQVCPYGNRNGGSTIAPASGVGAPVGLITARRLYGG